jgi:hypothetical protein
MGGLDLCGLNNRFSKRSVVEESVPLCVERADPVARTQRTLVRALHQCFNDNANADRQTVVDVSYLKLHHGDHGAALPDRGPTSLIQHCFRTKIGVFVLR